MVHLCFVCETPFHLLNCINYSYHVREDVSVDLYVRQEDYLNEDMIDRVRNEGLFENVYSYSYEKDRFHSFSLYLPVRCSDLMIIQKIYHP